MVQITNIADADMVLRKTGVKPEEFEPKQFTPEQHNP